MFALPVILILSIAGTLGVPWPDIDINRVVRVPMQPIDYAYQPRYYGDNFAVKHYYRYNRNNDIDVNSGWGDEPRAPVHIYDAATTAKKTPIKVYQPREDPRHFYQSDSYLKETDGQNMNEVSYIFLGKEVVHAKEEHNHKSLPLRVKNSNKNTVNTDNKVCVRCPHDRTLIAKAGSDRVLLQTPTLLSCSGHQVPRNIYFVHMYGPKFGSLLERGSHTIVGRIVNKYNSLQLCKMQINVVVQSCKTPDFLVSQCAADKNKPCNFTCRDSKQDLHGSKSLVCGDDMRWIGDLPICQARTWCDPPPPPVHGHLSCKGASVGNGPSMAEGSRCRVKCAYGWRSSQPGVSVCRRGAWTKFLTCKPKNTSS